MAYQGFLIQVGGYQITGESIINMESYQASIEVQDLDPFRSADGVLHRNALPHTALHVVVSTRQGVTGEEMAAFFANIRANFSIPIERKANVTAYVPEYNDYVTQACYMPTPEPIIRVIDPKTNVVKYNSFQLEWIGY